MLTLSRSSSELAVRTEGEDYSLSGSLTQTPLLSSNKAKTDCKVAGGAQKCMRSQGMAES